MSSPSVHDRSQRVVDALNRYVGTLHAARCTATIWINHADDPRYPIAAKYGLQMTFGATALTLRKFQDLWRGGHFETLISPGTEARAHCEWILRECDQHNLRDAANLLFAHYAENPQDLPLSNREVLELVHRCGWDTEEEVVEWTGPVIDRIRTIRDATAVREILHRELYRGVLVWGKSQKVIRCGTKKQRKLPQDQWLRLDAPELRVVSDELWNAVHNRLAKAAQLFPHTSEGTLLSRPSYLDGESPYLLTGFTACTICNGAVGGSTQLHGTGPPSNRKRVTFYGCVTHKKRGKTICANDITVRAEIVDHVLLDAISGALDERIIDVAVEKAIERLRAGQERNLDRWTQIERELSLIESRLGRLVEGITSGGPLDTLVAQLKVEEERKKALVAQLEQLVGMEQVASLDVARLKRDLKVRVADVRGLLGRHTPQARQMLQKLLAGKITMTPVTLNNRRGYRLSGNLSYGRLLQGEVFQAVGGGANSLMVVAPTGFDTFWNLEFRGVVRVA